MIATVSSIAAALANNLYLDRTFAYSGQIDKALEALTLEQVNAALRKYIHPDDFAFAFAGDFKGAATAKGADVPQTPTPGAAAAPRPQAAGQR